MFRELESFFLIIIEFLKFIDFKITTNSFIYSLVEQFLEAHFHKNNYKGKGVYFLKNFSHNFRIYIPPTWGILYEQQSYHYDYLLIRQNRSSVKPDNLIIITGLDLLHPFSYLVFKYTEINIILF